MNKLIYLSALILLVTTSCSTNKDLNGTYFKKGVDFTYKIVLNKDSTFALFHTSFEFNSKCQGKWHMLSKTEILLKCNSEQLIDAISSGNISDRVFNITLLKGNKIRIKNAVLKKVK